jgi:hypothetical protein
MAFEPRIADFTEAEQAPFLSHEAIIANINSKFIEYTSACDQGLSDETIIEQGFEPDYLGIRQWPMVQTCPVFTVPDFFNHFIRFHKDCFAREGVLGLQNFLPGDRSLYPGWDNFLFGQVIQDALRSLDMVMAICFGYFWTGTFAEVGEMIRNYRIKYHNLYHWDLISKALHKFFNVIGSDRLNDFPPDFVEGTPGSKTNPQMVKQYLVFLLRKNMSNASSDGCAKFMDNIRMQPSTSIGYMTAPPSDPTYQYSSKSKLGSKSIQMASTPAEKSRRAKKRDRKRSSSTKERINTQESVESSTSSTKGRGIVCMMDFIFHNQLQVSFVKGAIVACRKGSGCPFAHHKEISTWTAGDIWDGLKGAPQFKPPKGNPVDAAVIKKFLKIE